MENEGALFLGEWFGEGKADIALQAFLVVDNEGANAVARVTTTKFVRIPEGAERDFRHGFIFISKSFFYRGRKNGLYVVW